MNALILYFSGTGNTKYVAAQFRDALLRRNLTVQMHSIEENFDPASFAYDYLILGFPKYYELPVLSAMDAVKRSLPVRKKEIPVLAFCTQAGPLPTNFDGLEKLLKRKNHRLTVSKSFPFANNLLLFRTFRLTEPQEIEKNIAGIKTGIDPLLDTFFSGGESKENIKAWQKPLYRLVAVSFTKLMPAVGMKYSASEACTHCGLCAKRCPQKNIRMVDNRPVFSKDCIFCMRCINDCPANAILYHKKKCTQYKYKG